MNCTMPYNGRSLEDIPSRHLSYDALELVLDGGHDGVEVQAKESYLKLKGIDSSKERESYAGGDGRIFRVLGNNFFVLSFSQLLDSLSDSLLLLGKQNVPNSFGVPVRACDEECLCGIRRLRRKQPVKLHV
ncbi:hypothetical protein Tco_1482520 [Tanacetum coccineum]